MELPRLLAGVSDGVACLPHCLASPTHIHLFHTLPLHTTMPYLKTHWRNKKHVQHMNMIKAFDGHVLWQFTLTAPPWLAPFAIPIRPYTCKSITFQNPEYEHGKLEFIIELYFKCSPSSSFQSVRSSVGRHSMLSKYNFRCYRLRVVMAWPKHNPQ